MSISLKNKPKTNYETLEVIMTTTTTTTFSAKRTATSDDEATSTTDEPGKQQRTWHKHPAITPTVHGLMVIGTVICLLVPGLNILTYALLGMEVVNFAVDVWNATRSRS